MSENQRTPGQRDADRVLSANFDNVSKVLRDASPWLTVAPGRRPEVQMYPTERIARNAYEAMISGPRESGPAVRLYRQRIVASQNRFTWELVEEHIVDLTEAWPAMDFEGLEARASGKSCFVGWFYRDRLVAMLDLRTDSEGRARSLAFYEHKDDTLSAVKVVDLWLDSWFTIQLALDHLSGNRETIEKVKAEIDRLLENNDV